MDGAILRLIEHEKGCEILLRQDHPQSDLFQLAQDAAHELAELVAENARMKQRCEALDTAWTVGAPHADPGDCPTYYDGCHCTVENIAYALARAEEADRLLGEAKRRMMHKTELDDNDDLAFLDSVARFLKSGEPATPDGGEVPPDKPQSLAEWLWRVVRYQRGIFVRELIGGHWYNVPLSALSPKRWAAHVAEWLERGHLPVRLLEERERETCPDDTQPKT